MLFTFQYLQKMLYRLVDGYATLSYEEASRKYKPNFTLAKEWSDKSMYYSKMLTYYHTYKDSNEYNAFEMEKIINDLDDELDKLDKLRGKMYL